MWRVALVALAVTAAACASESPIPKDPATGLPIVDQLPAFPGTVAALEWRETSEPADGFGAGDTTHATIGDLVAAMREVAAEEDAELTVGFLGPPTAEEATLVVHSSSRDQAFAGDEIVAQLRRNERGWYVDLIRFRHHCRREVDADGQECV